MIVCIIVTLINIAMFAFTVWALIRLNRYITNLEATVEDYIKITEELGDLVRSAKLTNKNIIGTKNILDDE